MQYIHGAIEYLEIIGVKPTWKAINDFINYQIRAREELFK